MYEQYKLKRFFEKNLMGDGMGLFSKKPKITEPEMEEKILKIDIYSFREPNLLKHLKELKSYLKYFPEKKDEYTALITQKAKGRGFEFSSI